MKAADVGCEDACIEMLEKARNGLMHGATLNEVEDELPRSEEHVADILGKIVFKALVLQFPPEIIQGQFTLAIPSTYIQYAMTGVAHVQTVVPMDSEGEPDLGFSGMSVKMISGGPPQSARPTFVRMTFDQHERLVELSYRASDHQEMCQRICRRAQTQGNYVVSAIIATDAARILEAVKRGETGAWQDVFREIIEGGKPRDTPPTRETVQ